MNSAHAETNHDFLCHGEKTAFHDETWLVSLLDFQGSWCLLIFAHCRDRSSASKLPSLPLAKPQCTSPLHCSRSFMPPGKAED